MPSPENNPFANFINGLDSNSFSRTSDQVEDFRLIDTNGNNEFTYDVNVGLANFRTVIDTDLRNGSVLMYFLSGLKSFEEADLHTGISKMIDTAFPGQQLTPHVRVVNETSRNDYDLASYWDGKRYESALKEQPDSLIYYLPVTASQAAIYPLPHFMYGISRVTENEIGEYIRMNHSKGDHLNVELTQELLKRNRGYLGKDLLTDAVDLRDKIHELCVIHPQEKLTI